MRKLVTAFKSCVYPDLVNEPETRDKMYAEVRHFARRLGMSNTAVIDYLDHRTLEGLWMEKRLVEPVLRQGLATSLGCAFVSAVGFLAGANDTAAFWAVCSMTSSVGAARRLEDTRHEYRAVLG